MTPDEKYVKQLASELRLRQLPEAQVVEILREVSAESERANASPEKVFGSAEEYAKTFPEAGHRAVGYWVFLAAVLAAVGVLVYGFVARRVSPSGEPLWGALTSLGIAVVLVLGGFLVANALSRRIPKDL